MAFSFVSVTLETDIVLLGVQNLSFGRPGAFILPAWVPFGQIGDTQGDHGSSRKDTWGSGTRCLMILGRFGDPILKAFWAKMG